MPSDKQRMLAAQYYATQQQQNALASREQTEATRLQASQLLGTDAQVNGTLGYDPSLAYSGRYSLNQGAVTAGGLNSSKYSGRLTANMNAANNLLAQAQAAAEAGDFETADQLKQQAQLALLSQNGNRQYFRGQQIDGMFSLVGGDTAANRAAGIVSSPDAQLVGRQVQEARQFMDWDSEASVRQRNLLIEPAERAIMAGEREALRGARNTRMAGGAAQSPYASRMLDERTSQQAGFDRAQIRAQVGSAFLEFSRDYAANTAMMAQAFLNGEPYIRDQYQGALDQLRSNLSNLFQTQSGQHQTNFWNAVERKDAQNAETKAYQREMLMAGIGTALTVAGSFANIPGLGAAFGGTKGTQTQPTPTPSGTGQTNPANITSAFFSNGGFGLGGF